jgi:polyisoprenoid-binding protein YceI
MNRITSILAVSILSTLSLPAAATAQAGTSPLAISSANVSVDGTSNVHSFTASTTTVRLLAVEIAGNPGEDLLAHVLTPGALSRLDVAIPAATLRSVKGDIDDNMHKALKVKEFADIRFRLRVVEAEAAGYRAAGWLTIAGVEKDVSFLVQVQRTGAGLVVTGSTDLMMTDYGINPPRAMLGVLKTNPKVTIRLELTLAEAR